MQTLHAMLTMAMSPAEFRVLREQRDLTQEECADILRQYQSTVSRWEKEPGDPQHRPIPELVAECVRDEQLFRRLQRLARARAS